VAALAAGAARAATPPKQYLVISDPTFSQAARERMTQLGLTSEAAALASVATMDPGALRAGFRAVYLPLVADADQLDALRRLVAVGGVLERFARDGGSLVLVLAGYTLDQADIAPGGVDVERDGPHNVEAILTPTHPYFTGTGYKGTTLGRGSFGSWRNTDYGSILGLPEKATVLLRNEDGPSLVEYAWGRGHVIVTTLSLGWPGFPSRTGAAWNNLLLYGSWVAPAAAATVPVEKVMPRVAISSRGDHGELLRTPDGKPLYRVIIEDPNPSSGLAEIGVEGGNFQLVAVNSSPISALPLPYTERFAPGSNVTRWELLLEKVNMRLYGTLTVTVRDQSGNKISVRR
jgi:hypothetical protein